MDKLLAALVVGDEKLIDDLASGLFINSHGGCDWEAIKEFEKLANCKIFPLDTDSCGWLVGGISFQGRIFAYG